MPNDKIEWQAHEYFYFEKSGDWFWVVGVAILTGVIISIIFSDYLFAIVLAVGGFSLIVYAKRPPQIIACQINHDGITMGKNIYPYSFLNSFWVDKSEPHFHKILLKSKKTLMPLVAVPLGDTDPDMARDFLVNYLAEEELSEPLSQKIMEYLGF